MMGLIKQKGADIPIPDYADASSVETIYDYKGKGGKSSIRVPSYVNYHADHNEDDQDNLF